MDNSQERLFILEDAIKQLESVNKKIARLTLEKEELTQAIIAALGHNKEGQRTYDVGIYKVTAKTPNIYSLDTKAYKSGDIYIDPQFDPVKQTVSYTVDKKLFDQYFNTAPEEVRQSLVELITVKPGKASVSVGMI